MSGYKIMQSISQTIKDRKEVSAKSERAELIGLFTEELNQERGNGYYKDEKWHELKKLTPRVVAVKVGHIKLLEDLRFFYQKCHKAKLEGRSFSKVFFGSLKV